MNEFIVDDAGLVVAVSPVQGGLGSAEAIFVDFPVEPYGKYVDGVYTPPEQSFLREAWRRSASLDRSMFCISIALAGWVSLAEAKEAAKGEWPPTFANALKDLPEDEKLKAEITWAGATKVSRLNPILDLVKANTPGVTDEAIDTIFGWEAS